MAKKSRKSAPKKTPAPVEPVPVVPAPVKVPPAKADIARVAREIWEERRRPAGQDLEIWLEAERRLAK